MTRVFVALGGLNAWLTVALGALGAHGLKGRLSAEMLAVYHTGVQYHGLHALALILVGLLALWLPHSNALRAAGWLMLLGIVLFSGSLYVLSLTGARTLGMVTPFGGLCFLIAWALVTAAALRGP